MESEAQEAAAAMGRYCQGEPAAFHQLYALLAPRILAYLHGLLGDRAAAEDALQLTFLKVHEARSSYVMGANPIPWIYTIAHRTGLDEIRKRKRSRVKLNKEGETPAEPTAHITGVAAGIDAGPAGLSEPFAEPFAEPGGDAAASAIERPCTLVRISAWRWLSGSFASAASAPAAAAASAPASAKGSDRPAGSAPASAATPVM